VKVLFTIIVGVEDMWFRSSSRC